MSRGSDLIFVYGTLRKDSVAAERNVLEQYAEFLGEGETQGSLYVGEYPFAVPSDSPSERIKGEVYRLDRKHNARALQLLDEYEEYDPNEPAKSLYRRELTTVDVKGKRVQAWIYWYNGSLENAILMPEGKIGKDVHVSPLGKQWQVRLGREVKAAKVSMSKAGALSAARRLARVQRSKVILHDGKERA
jgi:gamma-glutamylcyclotransferase (GGCT)/AIG2-like uncharacterized protein YtfP